MIGPFGALSLKRGAIMKWLKPNGTEIETSDRKEAVEYCESLGWKPIKKAVKKKAVKKAAKKHV